MEMVKRAVSKARNRRQGGEAADEGTTRAGRAGPLGPPPLRVRRSEESEAAWAALPELAVDPRALRRRRVITLDKKDPAHMAYDMLRTRVLQALRAEGWRSVALTSPSPGCGKTLTTLNLAFSFARQPNCRTLVLELDLRRPRLGALLGARPPACVSRMLSGRVAPGEALARVGETLAFGLAARPIRDSSELLQDERTAETLEALAVTFAPDVILVDLPPMLATDDAAAFLGRMDGALLVAAAGQSSLSDVEDCMRQIRRLTTDLGVLLNKSRFMPRRYYEYATR